jgi:hypothetical protein
LIKCHVQDNWWQIRQELPNWHKSHIIQNVSKGKILNNSIDEILQVDRSTTSRGPRFIKEETNIHAVVREAFKFLLLLLYSYSSSSADEESSGQDQEQEGGDEDDLEGDN